MRPQLQAVASGQGGVFFRFQALEYGYTDEEIRRLKKAREWIPVRRGAYVERALAPARDDAVGWHRLRTLAVMHRVDVPAVASHSSAAVLLDLPQWGTDLSRVHLTRSRRHAGRIEAAVTHHEAALPDSSVTTAHGVPCTNGARTAWDIGREFGFEAGVVAADAVLHIGALERAAPITGEARLPRRGADPDDFDPLAASMADWPGARSATEAFGFADAGAESVGESLARLFVVSLGFPVPATQVVFRAGGLLARVDMLIEALNWVVEFDGRMKYRRTRDDCDPVVDDGDVVWAEKIREDRLRPLVRHVSRLVWADLFGSRRRATALEMWRTAERLGAPAEWRRPAWLRAA